MHIMTRAVLPHWPVHSVMVQRIRILEWRPPICMANARPLIRGQAQRRQRQPECLHWRWKQSILIIFIINVHFLIQSIKYIYILVLCWRGETSNIWQCWHRNAIRYSTQRIGSIGKWMVSAWSTIISSGSESLTLAPLWLSRRNGSPFRRDIIAKPALRTSTETSKRLLFIIKYSTLA